MGCKQQGGRHREMDVCVCECVCVCVCLIICVCVHRAIDVQGGAERCIEKRVKDRWVRGRNMRDGEENWKIGC